MILAKRKVLKFAALLLFGVAFCSPAKTTLAVNAELTFAPNAPAPLNRAATTVKVEMETIEVKGTLADGVEYNFWTFNGKVPGPMVRVKEGDTVEFTLKNNKDSAVPHNIDLHAVTGPGGGAVVTTVDPGDSKTVTFKAMKPGLYIYHCAASHIPTHISNGMYGLILVEPTKGLTKVDREFYVVQSEFYTKGKFGEKGLQEFDDEKALAEHPTYVVFNGSVGAVTGKGALTAKVGDTVRIFFGNGGPSLISSFHIIGEIFDRVWHEGTTGPPSLNIQTTAVPVAGAVMIEFKVDYPGTYVLVDHSIFRAIDKGAAGHLTVTGKADLSIYSPQPK